MRIVGGGGCKRLPFLQRYITLIIADIILGADFSFSPVFKDLFEFSPNFISFLTLKNVYDVSGVMCTVPR